ncbi:glycoside hydrolase family 27 protein [Actinoplanes solisilvae]|uniref:glycoside hydrolase family 27 protein n=1 Tax=Actinoplanes solisilvae TaxID=2486853 RepID=UPI001F0C20B5|nr:glycoside hydrolase family 27 protein [Actinoplanes solisilvae]
MRFLRTAALSALFLPLIAVPTQIATSASAAPPIAGNSAKPTGAKPTSSTQGLTPYMGWNTYFGLGGDPTENEVKSIADFMATNGLREAGYKVIWIDGNWAAPTPRNTAGELVADPDRFPSGMGALTRYLHDRGFQAGIYTDAGPYIPGQCGLGSHGYFRDDVRQFARWGFDALKADWLCGRAAGLDPETTFRQLAAEVDRSPRKMFLNICNPVSSDWGGGPYPPEQLSTWSYTYAPEIARSWRTYTDVGLVDAQPQWQYQWVLRNMDVNAYHPSATKPGHFNDPDYLVPMRPKPGGGTELTFDESKTQLGMWALMSAPLVIGSDPRTLPAEMIAALRNPEIVAVDQDPLVRQGVKVADPSSTTQVWSKTLAGQGRRAVALLNRGDTAQQITVNFADVALGGTARVRNLWTNSDAGTFTGSYTTTVPAHGVEMLGLTGTDDVIGTDLGPASDSPAAAGGRVFARGTDGVVRENVNGTWSSLGRPITGQPAAYASAGGRVDLFVRGIEGKVWHRALTDSRWGAWSDLGGPVADSPSVAFTSPTEWTVFARGTDGLVRAKSRTGAWTSIGGPNGRGVRGRPSAAVDASGAVHVTVRHRTDEIWERVSTNGVWSDWQNLGGTLNGSPTLLATEGRVYLFAVAADNRLWQRNFVDGAWGGWFQRSEFATDEIQGPLGTEPGPNGSAVIVLRGVDGHIHRTAL